MYGEPIKSLEEAIKEVIDDRPASCSYYHSWKYEGNRRRHSRLIKKIGNRMGKKMCRRIFSDYLEVEQLEGELHADLQRSCYRLGLNDAFFLMGEIERAKNGLPSIFSTR